MSELDARRTFDSTSAAGAMSMRQVGEPVLVGIMLAGLYTSTDHALPTEMLRRLSTEHTTAGAAVAATAPAGAAIGELRRLSGFTWEQLARLFGVSRRALHFWASGKQMSPGNEEHLQRILAVVRKIDRGSANTNRTLLLGLREDGSLPVDLLAAGKYDHVLSMLGQEDTRRAALRPLSEHARAARALRPPEELVGALHERIHPTSGRLRSATKLVIARRK
jgi:transcriptional regulator with XRE-family HTH domain